MDFKDVYNLFFAPGEVTEIRAYGLRGKSPAWEGFAAGKGIIYGYFDNASDFAKAAGDLENAAAPGIYFTLNPAQPDLLARANNRLKAPGPKPAQTTDKHILTVRWLPIDIDPKRPSGISSSEDELKQAIDTRNAIHSWLKEKFGVEPIPAVSGNGAHLMVRLPDMPATDDTKNFIQKALTAINEKFGDASMDIDLSVYNPSRIWKLYGTTARKGDSIPARPHRKSYVHPKFMQRGANASDN